MNARYILLTDDAYIGENGKLYAEGIFEEIYNNKFPVVHKRLVIAMSLEGTKKEVGKHELKINLHDWSNKTILSVPIVSFELGGEKQTGPVYRAGIIATLRNIHFKKPGEYRFSVLIDGIFFTGLAFTVMKVQIIDGNESAIA